MAWVSEQLLTHEDWRSYLPLLAPPDVQADARTLAKASDELALSYSHVRALAAAHRWQDRAAAWDAHQQRQYTAELEEERRRAAREDVKVLRIMTGMIGQALPNVQQEMTLAEFTRFADTTMEWKRTLFGDPTETIAVTGPVGDPLTVQLQEFTALPPEQRRVRLAELAAPVARRARAMDGADDEDTERRRTRPATTRTTTAPRRTSPSRPWTSPAVKSDGAAGPQRAGLP